MIQGLLLAAGTSSRLGQPKQLLELNGKSLLELSVLHLLKVTPHVKVLLGAEINQSVTIVERLKLVYPSIEYLVCETFKEGMGSTLSEGFRSLNPDCAVIVHLVDLPFVNEILFNRLIDQNKLFPEKAIVSSFRGLLAPPILIPYNLVSQLNDWKGEKGLGQFWKSNPQLCEFVEFDEDYQDVDTMEDYLEVIGKR
ncbi:MAG: NTP transferase domain-containing protein [Aquirufa sp.]